MDGLIVYCHSLVVVCVPSDYSVGIAIGLFVLRMVCSYYIPFYEGSLKRMHTFLQGVAIILLSALQVCRIEGEVVLFMTIAAILIAGLHQVLYKTSNMDYWRVPQGGLSKIEECKVILSCEQTFGYVFR